VLGLQFPLPLSTSILSNAKKNVVLAWAVGGAAMANGKWQMANGKWQMANGKWQMANGKWQMANPQSRR
jgi:hypothetical protein